MTMDFASELISQLPWLRQMAGRYCKGEDDIQDLVNDTVLRLWQTRDSFDESHAFRSLAYKVMQNIYINQYNRSKFSVLVEDFPTKEPTTHAHADALIRAKQVIQHVRQASTRSICIRPVIMYALGYSYREIADFLRIPLGTVQRRIHEGRRILKQELHL